MDDTRLKQRVQEISQSVKNVRANDLYTLLDNHIKLYCEARSLHYDHRVRGSHHIFTVGEQTISLPLPHGSSHLRPVYVLKFLDVMQLIGLYEEE